jgi:hypothetical protein
MSEPGPFELTSSVLGGLPVVNYFWHRLRLDELLAVHLPVDDARLKLAPATAVRLVVTNLLVGREPLYGLGEWAARFVPGLLGLGAGQAGAVNDDRVGRALERLFDADRASLLTALVLRAVQEFGIDTSECHNDSTSITVSGAYRDATGVARARRQTHPGDHLWALQGPPTRPQAAGVDPDRGR